jgi:hypothetical protein
MYEDYSIGVVVPAYNEAEFIGEVVRDLPRYIDNVYLVDDASTDDTWDEMGSVMRAETAVNTPVPSGDDGVTESAEPREPVRSTESLGEGSAVESTAVHTHRVAAVVSEIETIGSITRLRHAENRGPGGAIKTGYLAAVSDGVEVVVTIDGDGQMDCDRLKDVIDPIVSGQAGYAKGDRLAHREALWDMPTFRLFGNVVLTGLTRLSSGFWGLSDPQNGFTAVSSEVLCEIDLQRMWEYYGYMNQLLAQLNAAGITVVDVPMPAQYGDEESSIGYWQYIRRVSLLLVVSFLGRLRGTYTSQDGSKVAIYYGLSVFGVVGSVTWKLVSDLTEGEGPSWHDVVVGVAISLTAFLVAVFFDANTGPTVETPTESPTGTSRSTETTAHSDNTEQTHAE